MTYRIALSIIEIDKRENYLRVEKTMEAMTARKVVGGVGGAELEFVGKEITMIFRVSLLRNKTYIFEIL